MAEVLRSTGHRPNKMYMSRGAFLALGGSPEALEFVTNEYGVVEINPSPEKQEKLDGV